MAPSKKSKSVNRGFATASDSSPSKDEKSKQKKRKLSVMLGPQWSKHELERFYEAYRKYGHDWKKVAGIVLSRSAEMVEALYNMNKAYLSLPEGTASVVGLIAMMTDHYNVMEGSGSEKDCEGPTITAQKFQKYPKAKGRLDSTRDDCFHRQSIGSSDRCLYLLKMGGYQPYFPVRKRTPRVPVSCLDTDPNKKPQVSVMNGNDREVSHGALLLTEAWQNPNSLHGPQTYRKFEHVKASPVSAKEKALSQLPMLNHKNRGFTADEEFAEGSLGNNETKFGNLASNSVDLGKSTLGEQKKGKKGKKEDVEHSQVKPSDDIRESFKFTDKGTSGYVGSDSTGAKIHRSPSEGQRKRNKKLIFEDERLACDALKTLAETSAMMPYLAAEPVEDAGESVTERNSIVGSDAYSDIVLKDESANGEFKKKCKSQAPKVQKAELHGDFCRKPAKNETLVDEEVKSADSSGQMSTVSKRRKLSVRSPDVSSSNDRYVGEIEVAISRSQVHPASLGVVNPTRRKNSRKRDRKLLQMDRNYAPSVCSSEHSSLLQDRMQCVKEKILHSLSWHDVRRWCIYEWFYSAIDYPWFAKSEFVEYLNHVGLGHIPRLTRVEWGVIRSSLGKPRRFSERFLQEEREKLQHYRESVRTHYANLRAGVGEGLPTDLAHPLSVGQQVVAIHPKTTECHNGSVLTVDHHNCLVQFDRPDLGVELVMDIDCMPLNLVENMPEALRGQRMLFDYRYSQVPKVNGAFILAPEEHMQNAHHHCLPPFSSSVTDDIKVKPACMSSHTNVTGNGSSRTLSTKQNQSSSTAHLHQQKGDTRPILGLNPGFDRKVCNRDSACSGNPFSWPQPVADSSGINGTIHSSKISVFSCQETASNVAEVVEGSRGKAQNMVDIAIKVMSVMKEGEDAFVRIGEALDATKKVERATNCSTSVTMSTNTVAGTLNHQNPVTSCSSEPQLAGNASSVKSAGGSAVSDLQVPSDLITSCVATLLMIQSCTERQYPPAEVAQILDNAVTSLHPCCPRNVSIYREIQMCMGRIKTQILALVPT